MFTIAYCGVEAFIRLYVNSVYSFIARQIRPSVTRPIIKINPVEGAEPSKSRVPEQPPLLPCSSAGTGQDNSSISSCLYTITRAPRFIINNFLYKDSRVKLVKKITLRILLRVLHENVISSQLSRRLAQY